MSASHSDRQISKVGGRVDHDDDDEDKHGGGSSGRDSVHVKKNPVENCKSNFHVMDRSVEMGILLNQRRWPSSNSQWPRNI